MIPEGWKPVDLLDIGDVTYGFPFRSKLFTSEQNGKKIIRIRNIVPNRSETSSVEDADKKYLVKNGDILVGMDGDFHIGKWAGGDAYLNQRVCRFCPKKGISDYFLFHSIKIPIQELNQAIVGTTVAHLSARDIKSIMILRPSDEILEHCLDIFEPILAEEILLRQKNDILRQTRDLLLPKLISDKIDVSELDIDVGVET